MIYLDNHATTPCDPRVVEGMMPYYFNNFGNPSSGHPFGREAALAVEQATDQINELINGQHGELIFTSGATESNNIILLGLAAGYFKRTGKTGRIVTTQIEHKAILAPLQHLEAQGWIIDYLPLDVTGLVDLELAAEVICDGTILVSVQMANSEIGTIQPIDAITKLAHRVGALMHTDAAQAVGKIKLDVEFEDVDTISFSAHKINGPKGIGAFWIKHEVIKLVEPIIYGGDSGNKLRPGTVPVQLIIGFGIACRLYFEELGEINNRLALLRDRFECVLLQKIDGLTINGNLQHRLPNNSNITFPGVEAEMLLANLPEIIASTGSACESGSIEPSRVLTAIGISRELAYNTIRIGLGKFNTEQEIEDAVNMIIDAYSEIRVALDYSDD